MRKHLSLAALAIGVPLSGWFLWSAPEAPPRPPRMLPGLTELCQSKEIPPRNVTQVTYWAPIIRIPVDRLADVPTAIEPHGDAGRNPGEGPLTDHPSKGIQPTVRRPSLPSVATPLVLSLPPRSEDASVGDRPELLAALRELPQSPEASSTQTTEPHTTTLRFRRPTKDSAPANNHRHQANAFRDVTVDMTRDVSAIPSLIPSFESGAAHDASAPRAPLDTSNARVTPSTKKTVSPEGPLLIAPANASLATKTPPSVLFEGGGSPPTGDRAAAVTELDFDASSSTPPLEDHGMEDGRPAPSEDQAAPNDAWEVEIDLSASGKRPRQSRKHPTPADTLAEKPHQEAPGAFPGDKPTPSPAAKLLKGPASTKLTDPSTTDTNDEEPAPIFHSGDPWYVPDPRAESEEAQQRAQRIRRCLEFYYNRQLNTIDDSPWSMMHHMIAWGSDSLIWRGRPGQSERVNCIGWLCANGACEGERLLFVKQGKLIARTGPGLQGHAGQFLAMLAQARVPIDQPLRVDGQMFTVRDLIAREQSACRPKTELTFRLIGLTHYLGTEATWKSSDRQDWSISRLIQEEIRQPINGTTCGGTHRLMGLSYAVRKRQQEGLPVDGQFARAEKYTGDYQNYTYAGQNRNGSFSSDFWRSRGDWGDIDRKLKTTGHMLEWMVFALPHDKLYDPRLVRAVDYLTMLMLQNRYYDWGTGPLGHGVRALSLYDERVYGGQPGKRDLKLASRPPAIRSKTTRTSPSPTRSPAPPRRPVFSRFGR